MSSPQDIAFGTNNWAMYKERHGDRWIRQFDTHKFPYSQISVLQLYPMVGQVADALTLEAEGIIPKTHQLLDCRAHIV